MHRYLHRSIWPNGYRNRELLHRFGQRNIVKVHSRGTDVAKAMVQEDFLHTRIALEDSDECRLSRAIAQEMAQEYRQEIYGRFGGKDARGFP